MSTLNNFWNALLNELQNGLFYFNGPLDLIVAIFDIAVTTFLIYFVLKLISETQAWQLLKGIVAVVIFVIIGGFLGLKTINYVLINFASVFAIALIIIFQPEMRRALETVGRKSSNIFSASGDRVSSESDVRQVVESIVVACAEMAKTKTGALIIIERETKLGDLIESGAVVIDADLTSTMLRQIFYVNSPMHDGAVIIRGGRIYATRVHVPLSESYHLKRELGTRHRAAIGASEIGDAISVVVSEERGTISISIHGRLYTLDDADSLRAILIRLLSTNNQDSSNLPNQLRKILRIDKTEKSAKAQLDTEKGDDTFDDIEELKMIEEHGSKHISGLEVTDKPHRRKLGIFSISLATALALWLFVRITTNPVVQKTFTVPIQTIGIENLYERQLDFYMGENSVRVSIKGRQEMLNSLQPKQIDASVNFNSINQAGTYNLETKVEIEGISSYAYTAFREPTHVSVIINQVGKTETTEDDKTGGTTFSTTATGSNEGNSEQAQNNQNEDNNK